MKKIIILLLSFLSVSLLSALLNVDVYHTNLVISSEIAQVNKLKEIATKYDSNKESLLNYNNFVAPESNTNGNMDYVNYTDNVYSRQTTFNKNNYFENLYEFSAYNSVGSCGYVSLIQALSYYDTFYNDNIIPNVFDRSLGTATDEANIKLHSPGVINQIYNSSIYSSYYQYCHDTQAFDFQSYLTILHNNKLNTDNNETGSDSNGNTTNKFKFSIGGWDYQDLMDDLYLQFPGSVVVNGYSEKTQLEFTNLIRETIETGNPIIVHIKKYDSFGKEIGFHSVVAYEYNGTDILSNYGWGREHTHTKLLGGANGYSEITHAYTLDFSSMGHTHSNNYIINGEGHCGCNVSDKILFNIPFNWKNVPPTLYWMKDLYDSNETYTISFKSSMYGDDLFTYTTLHNQITLSPNARSSILLSCNGNIYVKFKRNSGINESYYNSNTYVYNEPSATMERIVLAPSEYGFDGRYYFANEGIKNLSIQQGKYVIDTTRLRCGYIEQEYIVLSPRRVDAGLAYLVYNFNCQVYRIDVDLTMWSDYEYLDKYNDIAKLEYLSSNLKWEKSLDLLKDITLPTDRTNPGYYSIVFPEGTTSIQFIVSSPATGNRNKGRICIGDMNIYIEGNQ